MSTNQKMLYDKYEEIIVILSPPRCSSTALARVFWEHPSVRYYAHEPFESLYYDADPIENIFPRLENPLDLTSVKKNGHTPLGNTLVIKEMPYQVGEHLDFLVGLATKPIVFLIRDPRINIASRIKHKLLGGAPAMYPFIESGWHLIQQQIIECRARDVPFCIIESKDFRNHPEIYLNALFTKLNLPFSKQILTWTASPAVELDNLGGLHAHLYEKILSSNRLTPDTDITPALDQFSIENGFQKHVEECMQIYCSIQTYPEIVRGL